MNKRELGYKRFVSQNLLQNRYHVRYKQHLIIP